MNVVSYHTGELASRLSFICQPCDNLKNCKCLGEIYNLR